MGVTTYWWGSVEVEPPITAETADLLERLCNHEVALDGAPEGRNGWVAGPDRRGRANGALVWDEGEKFNDGADWLRFLLEGQLAGHAATGTVLGFCTPEHLVYEAHRIDVEDNAVEVTSYQIPHLFDHPRGDDFDEGGELDDAMYELAGMDGQPPDIEESARVLDQFLSVIPLTELGQTADFVRDVSAFVGGGSALEEVLDRHR